VIIRRRHTANFTTISNVLFRDERLKADEVGILAYLLSQPDDWEVRRSALQRRWGVGDERIKRIVDNWMRTGWCRAIKTRVETTGRFHIDYEICDEPGLGMSDEEIRQALSVVSTEADPDGENPPQPPDNPPPPTQPGVGHQGVVTGGSPVIRDLQKTEIQNPPTPQAVPADRPQAAVREPPNFKSLAAKWPKASILSASAAERRFLRLTAERKQAAIDGVDRYLAELRHQGWKICDLQTYLRDRRWESVKGAPVATFPVHGNTPQAYRWLDYWIAIGQSTSFVESLWRQRKPYYTPTEWPPPLPSEAKKSG
jgi:hypothetical protein